MPEALNVVFNILTSGLPCCLLAIGIFLTFRVLDFADLSAEGSFLLGAALTAACIYRGINPFLATLLGMLVGVLCGILTGILNRILKIPKLLSGIITLTVIQAVFVILKVIEVVSWSWWVIFLPTIIPASVILVGLLIITVLNIIA